LSIYSTIGCIGLTTDADDWPVRIWIQGVPGHIVDDVSWLPPPFPDPHQAELYGAWRVYGAWRAVVFVHERAEKGTARSGQEYAETLLVLTGKEWDTMPFGQVLGLLWEALERS